MSGPREAGRGAIRWAAVPALAVILLLSACGSDSTVQQFACTAEFAAGISIRVLDSASGNPISCGAKAVVTASGYSETVENPAGPGCLDNFYLLAAGERPGTYSVTVSKAGYSDYVASNVEVTANVCHVNTVYLDALLVAN